MSTSSNWENWESGDCLYAPEGPDGSLAQSDLTSRLKQSFRQATIDWTEGDRWVEARIEKAIEAGYQGILLEAEKSLRNHVALVSISDLSDSSGIAVKFFLTPDTGTLELHYEPATAFKGCRGLAARIADCLGYELGQ